MLTIVLYAMSKKLRKKSLFLVINMAVADLMLGAVLLPALFYIIGVDYQLWTPSGQTHSYTFIFVFTADTVFLQGSLLSATAISVERFYAVYWPLEHRTLSKRSYRNVIFMVWTFSITVSAIFIVSFFTSTAHADDALILAYICFHLILLYFSILLFIVCGCNIGIWRKFQQRRFASQHQNRASQNQRLTKTLLFVSVIALLSWVPFISVLILNFSYAFSTFKTALRIAVILNFSNCFVNPIVYALRIPEFRQALGLRCFRRKTVMNLKGNERRDNRATALTQETHLCKYTNQIQPETIHTTVRLQGINLINSTIYSPEPQSDAIVSG